MSFFDIFTQNILTPPILFFLLGIVAGLIKSDLNLPANISRYLSIYLMMAIGFRVALRLRRQIGSILKSYWLYSLV